MQIDPESDLEDAAAEFFRRGDEGDYTEAEAESLPAGSIAFSENNDESNQPDRELLEQQLGRRARYTRSVTLGMSALSLVTAVALITHVREPSAGDSPNTDDKHTPISDASPPRYGAVAPAKGLAPPPFSSSSAESRAPDLRSQMPGAPLVSSAIANPAGAILELAVQSKAASAATAPLARATNAAETTVRPQPSTVSSAAVPRAAKVAKAGARGAARQALASGVAGKPPSRSSLASLATIQASPDQAASRPPTARFAD